MEIGTRVRTIKPDVVSDDWTPEAVAARRFGVTGTVVAEHDGRSLCFGVRHDEDDTIGFYELRELGTYKSLTIRATDPLENIWLADDEGNLVQKETGEMKTRILPGRYVVHFGLNSQGVPFDLYEDREIIQGRGD